MPGKIGPPGRFLCNIRPIGDIFQPLAERGFYNRYAIPDSGVSASQLKLGNSAPYYLAEESDSVMVTWKGTLDDNLNLLDLKKQMNKYFEILL